MLDVIKTMAFLLDSNVFANDRWLSDNVMSFFEELSTPEIIIGVLLLLFTLMVKFYVFRWQDGCEDPRTKQKGWSFSGIFAGLVCAIGLTFAVITTLHQHNWNIQRPAAQIADTMASIAKGASGVAIKAANVANKAALAGYESAARVAGPIYTGI